jgi:oligopeptide/dipeptide ABC transporter ATP-binding protein
LAASLLTITAGLVFLISVPTDGSNSTHQTSPRFTVHVVGQCVAQSLCLFLTGCIDCHGTVAVIEGGTQDVRTQQILNELAHAPLSKRRVQPVIDDNTIPRMHDTGRARTPVSGEVPNPLNPPAGCAFNPRRPHANERCRVEPPVLQSMGGVRVACHAVEEGRV